MRENLRARYYDLFSRFYDTFVALHSRDAGAKLRSLLARSVGLRSGDRVLDICTGTGELLRFLRSHVNETGSVWAIDFSRGMLREAKKKYDTDSNVFLIQANVKRLPFRPEVFDGVTCSHAFYELKEEVSHRCLEEIVRVLGEGGRFVMMEHEIPKNFFIRMLFYLRMFSLGRKRAAEVLRKEEEIFVRYFRSVEKIRSETGRSKMLIGSMERDVV